MFLRRKTSEWHWKWWQHSDVGIFQNYIYLIVSPKRFCKLHNYYLRYQNKKFYPRVALHTHTFIALAHKRRGEKNRRRQKILQEELYFSLSLLCWCHSIAINPSKQHKKREPKNWKEKWLYNKQNQNKNCTRNG